MRPQERDLSRRVAGSVDDLQPVQFVEGLAIHNTSVNLHWRNAQQIFDEELEEDQVQKAGCRRHWSLTNSALDDYGVKGVSNYRGAGHLFELCRTASVILVVASEGCVIQVRGYEGVPFAPDEVASVSVNHKRWNFREWSDARRHVRKSIAATAQVKSFQGAGDLGLERPGR
jgi:hypothetical protein